MPHKKYFILNAAVTLEAYDTVGGVSTKSWNAMTPAEWRPYLDRVRSSHWYELFLSSPVDARQRLTWKGLFKDVDNTVAQPSSDVCVWRHGRGLPPNEEYDDICHERTGGDQTQATGRCGRRPTSV